MQEADNIPQQQSKYMLPEKIDEMDRLHKQHAVFKNMLQGNFQAPLKEQLTQGITVLDSGCGPGAWTIDVAKEFPNSTFHGIDITASYLPEGEVPENCHFGLANIAEKIPYPDNYFDYVHQRLLVFGLSADDWEKALQEIFRVVKPGGYVEFAEMSNEPINIGPLFKFFRAKTKEFMDLRKMSSSIAIDLKDRLTKTGFINQKQIIAKLKINHTDKATEVYWEDCRHVFYNLKPFVVATNPEWADDAAYQKFLDDCGEECKELKTCSQFFIYYAQKPF